MSVSYVVPVWREDVYASVAKPWMQQQLDNFGGELIEVRQARSIFQALEVGRQTAKHRYIMYVHDDVRLLTPDNLTQRIGRAFRKYPRLGLLGPVGKVTSNRVPWWLNYGRYVGHWCRRGNQNQLVYQYADDQGNCPWRNAENEHDQVWNEFAEAGFVDGFYLIEDRERMSIPWDTETYGDQWHGYDVDRCCQARQLGLQVMVPPWLFLHDNAGHAGYKGTNPRRMFGRDQANRRINSKGDEVWLADLESTNTLVRQKWGLA